MHWLKTLAKTFSKFFTKNVLQLVVVYLRVLTCSLSPTINDKTLLPGVQSVVRLYLDDNPAVLRWTAYFMSMQHMILMWAVYAHDRDLFKGLTRHNFHLICPNSNGQRICHNRTMQDPTVTRPLSSNHSIYIIWFYLIVCTWCQTEMF